MKRPRRQERDSCKKMKKYLDRQEKICYTTPVHQRQQVSVKAQAFLPRRRNTVVLSSFSACRKRRFLFAKKMRLCLRQILKGGMENAQ